MYKPDVLFVKQLLALWLAQETERYRSEPSVLAISMNTELLSHRQTNHSKDWEGKLSLFDE